MLQRTALPDLIATRDEPRTLKEIGVDPTTFDNLLRRIGRQTTRRATLATLLGGAHLLHAPAASDATKEAQRRKRRRRKRARTASLQKGVSIWLDNINGKNAVTVTHSGWRNPFPCCRYLWEGSIPSLGDMRLNTSFADASVWLQGKYWFYFDNPLVGLPRVRISVNGRKNFSCCWAIPGDGDTVEAIRELNVGEDRTYDIDGHVFRVIRNRDMPKHKSFTIVLPRMI